MLFILVAIVGKALEISKTIHETLRNISALGVIGKIGEVHVKGNYNAMKDVVVVTSTKIGERKKYITKKVTNVARASGIAKKVTYDVTYNCQNKGAWSYSFLESKRKSECCCQNR